MDFINSILSENLINALGWTIIHSLWQGAAAALGLALIMFFMRRSGARTRYLLGVAALTLVLVMSLVTFVSIYSFPGIQGISASGGNGSVLALTDAAKIEDSVTLAVFFKSYFNRHLPLVVTVWLLGILVLTLRFAGGYFYNKRLKLHRNHQLPASWQNRLETFCRQIGIRKPIRLVESALVKSPLTIGHFKPIILFPLGLVTGLPRDQVEALLAHELAHILRKDYLVNILQNFVDILFFYHPGVRWISSHIRVQRENCCDDIAVSLSGDSLNVAKALTNIQEYDMRTPAPAMAAAGNRSGAHALLARVKRLLSPSAQGSDFSAGTVISSIMIVGLLTLVLTAHALASLNRDGVSYNNPEVKSASTVDEEQNQVEKLEDKEKEELIKLVKEMKERKEKLREKGLLKRDPGIKRKSRTEVLKERGVRREREERMRTRIQREEVRNEGVMREQTKRGRIQRKDQNYPIYRFVEVLIPELIQDKLLISDKAEFDIHLKNGKFYINFEEQPEAVYKKYKKLYEKITGKKLDDRGFSMINRK
ncbi:MAG: M56 family metallopeptidase [Candidatus Aminicenantes bacterium]|nr:MAG: M56 family metallopeptidase [Candidatus Aminicenantes bacterium]